MASLVPLSSLIIILFSLLSFSEAGFVGVNYGRIADNLPPPEKVAQLLKSQGINRVKLFDTDATVLSALAGTNISVVVALPNELLASAAASQSFTDSWVQSNVAKYHPETHIESIAVGNEVFVDPNNTTQFLISAINNLYASLHKSNLDSAIKISSPIALSALQNSYPASSGSFKPELIEPVIKPMLEFLRKTGSFLMVNAYPFFAYESNADVISLDYALFRENPGNVDAATGLRYTNLFDAQLDAVYAAMKSLQYNDVKIVVSETGWPSKGDEKETGAGEENAASYNGNLVRKILTGKGTPMRPNDEINVYLFALFNENLKNGPTSEKNYGLFYPNEQKVYDISLTSSAAVNGIVVTELAAEAVVVGRSWCVANVAVGAEKLKAGIDYACGEGGADCRPIQKDATCYDPDSLEAHASYAFNSYYQKKARAAGTCDFGGAAHVVTQPPRYGSCEFPTGY